MTNNSVNISQLTTDIISCLCLGTTKTFLNMTFSSAYFFRLSVQIHWSWLTFPIYMVQPKHMSRFSSVSSVSTMSLLSNPLVMVVNLVIALRHLARYTGGCDTVNTSLDLYYTYRFGQYIFLITYTDLYLANSYYYYYLP